MSNRVIACLGLGLLAVALTVVSVTGLARHASRKNEPYYSRAAAIRPGMTEADVVQQLGDPAQTYERETAPQHYYAEGYSYRERPISHKVLIYFGGMDMIVYVYLDRQGRVEDVYMGGS